MPNEFMLIDDLLRAYGDNGETTFFFVRPNGECCTWDLDLKDMNSYCPEPPEGLLKLTGVIWE